MADERTERCSAPLATKETQAKTATRAHSRTRQTTRRRRPRWARRGKAGPSHTAGGSGGGAAALGSLAAAYKTARAATSPNDFIPDTRTFLYLQKRVRKCALEVYP